nr:ATP-binding cassette domain-containing protein [Actinomadura sp. HBU206391]
MNLTKRYGGRPAVDGLSFQVRPGAVTGFLGPNGAGKSTTMRLILGLDAPSGGRVVVNGRPYRALRAPLREVGALLDAKAVHSGRSAYHHLLWLARSNGLARRRVEEVLEQVGLASVARKRAGGFSLGMGQRLGLAAALLGNPGTLILDEPVNGLDTEGIRWLRSLLKGLADEGRTVLLSSHLMSEMELTADHLIVIGRGRLLADTPMREFIERNSRPLTVVRSPNAARLRAVLEERGALVQPHDAGAWLVSGLDAAGIGKLAIDRGIELHELAPRLSSLEEAYTKMTDADVEYRALDGGSEPRIDAETTS